MRDVYIQIAATPAAVQSCIGSSVLQPSVTHDGHELRTAEGLESHSRLTCSATHAASMAELSLQHLPGQLLDGALPASPITVNQEQHAHLAHLVSSLENCSCDNTGHECHDDATANRHRSFPYYASGLSSLCQAGNAATRSSFMSDAFDNVAANFYEGVGAATNATCNSLLASDAREQADSGRQPAVKT